MSATAWTALINQCEHRKKAQAQPWAFLIWWSRGGSNSRPSHCERDALPAELRPHVDLMDKEAELPPVLAGPGFYHLRGISAIHYGREDRVGVIPCRESARGQGLDRRPWGCNRPVSPDRHVVRFPRLVECAGN